MPITNIVLQLVPGRHPSNHYSRRAIATFTYNGQQLRGTIRNHEDEVLCFLPADVRAALGADVEAAEIALLTLYCGGTSSRNGGVVLPFVE